MQTKSLLVRIGIMAGIPIAALALFLHHRAPSSQPIASNHSGVTAPSATSLTAAQKTNFTNAYGKLPLAFEVNQGQSAPEVRYLAHGQNYQLFLTNQEAVLTLRQPAAASAKSAKRVSPVAMRMHHEPGAALKTSVLRMRFDGASPAAEITGANQLPGKTNYFIGNDPKNWHTDVSSYEAVRYQGIYPGVDMLFYGRQQRLEYDFIVAPGADPNAIALRISGARKLELNSQGDVLLSVAEGKVALQKPVVYQEVNGQRREIVGNYTIARDHQIRFAVAPYDHTQPLTIDPILNYSTFVGGEAVDLALGVALDVAGDAYIAGSTSSVAFPQMNPVSGTTPADLALGTAFVTELNPNGTALIYSTYLGGSGINFGDQANAITVDTATPPNIYVTGFTGSSDFPVSTTTGVAPFQGTAPGSVAAATSGFVTELAPSASGTAQLAYSSYLGGDTNDVGNGIALDSAGKVYVVGATQSTNFPAVGTQITAGLDSAAGNAFLSKFDTTVAATPGLLYSTHIGGSGAGNTVILGGFADVATAVTIDAAANAYLVGGTMSTDYPVAGTAIAGSANCGANGQGSAFITIVNTTAQTLTYSHCLSGNPGAEIAFGVTLGTGVPVVVTKIVYVTGTTSSANFPHTAQSIPPAGSVANGVAFMSMLNPLTGALQYSTFLGGTNSDTGFSVASDSAGLAYVVGQTASQDFPTTQGAVQPAQNDPNANGEAFIAKISPNGQGAADLVYSTYFGSSATNATVASPGSAQGIALSDTTAYVAGYTATPDMPTTMGAFQTAPGATNATNAFVVEFPFTPTISVSPTSINFGTQLVGVVSQPQFVTVTNNTASAVTLTLPPTTTGTNLADFAGAAGGITPCTTSLAAGASCMIGVTFTPSNPVAETATLNIVDSLDTSTHPILVALSGTGTGTGANITVTPTSLTLPGALLTSSSNATVSISNNGNAPLSISAIATAPGVFTQASNTASCNNGAFPIVIAPAGADCVVTITFSPIATTPPGPVAGSLTITQTGGNMNTIPLSAPAWDFSVSAAAISVAKGATGSFPVVVTGLGGFTGAVAFSCTPAMLITSCSVPTTNAAPAPGATASGSITAMSFIVPPQSMKVPPSALLRQVLFIMMAIGLLLMLPEVRRIRARLGMLGAMMVFILVAGCSGGGGGGSKSSTVTITPSSGGVTKTAITVNVTITP